VLPGHGYRATAEAVMVNMGQWQKLEGKNQT
jgi:hypothetical protein